MKVLLLNGSPRKNGCTYTALNVVADALKAEGIDAEVFQAGDPDMENVKAAAAKLKDSDALVVGSPVYWLSLIHISEPRFTCLLGIPKRPDHRIYGPSGICSRKRYAL